MRALLLAALVTLTAAQGRAAADDDLAAARTAWRYFERNTDAATGLVSAVDGFPSTTTWDLGSSIVAIVAARELGILDAAGFDSRAGALLRTLSTMPLFQGALPNKAYDSRTARMTDYENHPVPGGIGFSAIDLGRLVSALALLGELHPERAGEVERVLARWQPCRAVRGGELRGVYADQAGKLHEAQEGRLGYEQYAARGLALLGLDVSLALRYDRFRSEVSILGVPVPRDARDRRRFGAVDAVVTEPWVLGALEFGPDIVSTPLARRVFEVQKRRFERTGIVTAVSEDHVDRPPWFVYGSIWADGTPWRTVTPAGADASSLRGLSTKAAFSLAVLHPDDPYAEVLRRAMAGSRDPERGWYAGTYEKGGENKSLNANTNGVILEAILYEKLGALHRASVGTPERTSLRERLASIAGRSRACNAGAAGGDGGGFALGPAAFGTAQGGPGAPLPAQPAGRTHVSGSLLADWRGPEGPGFGGIATVWPRGAWFLRFGAEATPQSKGGDARLLWGFGYDDWHDGTLSVTLHNWGPVYPQDGPGVRQAELNVGYKVPRVCSEWLCGAFYPFVTVPFAGGPYVGGRLTLTFSRRVFVMGGVGWTIPRTFEPRTGPAPAWRMFYGFGLWDWRPGSVFVTYHDWGPDWRAHNGILAVGVNWQF